MYNKFFQLSVARIIEQKFEGRDLVNSCENGESLRTLNKFPPYPESLSAVPRMSFEVPVAVVELPPTVCLSKLRCLSVQHFRDLSIPVYARTQPAKPCELQSIVSTTWRNVARPSYMFWRISPGNTEMNNASIGSLGRFCKQHLIIIIK